MIWVGEDAASYDEYDALRQHSTSMSDAIDRQQGVWKPGKHQFTAAVINECVKLSMKWFVY